ncbi:restriction endonuclease subunit S, partial [Kamptonema formosum]
TSSANTNINQESLSAIILFYPCKKEQEKITGFLTAMDRKIETLSRQIDQTEQFKKGLLQKMFV